MGYSLLSKYRSELMGVAMLWVMLFHARDLDFGVEILNLFRGAGFGGVDIFILLSAMGLSMSLDRKEQEYGTFMARRARRILPAYYLVMIPYTLFCIWQGTASGSTLVWNCGLLSYWVGSKGAFNWYISGIMLFYALTPWCYRKLKTSEHRERLVAGGTVVCLAACQILMRDGYWNHMDVVYRIPVFFLGLLLGLYIREERAWGGESGLFWAASAVFGIGYLAVALSGISEYLPLCHLFLFTTVPMCFVLCLLFDKLPLGLVQKGLRLVGENSLEIYLLNVSLFAQRELLQRILDFGPGHYIYYLITFALNILMGVGLHFVMEVFNKNA